jgi:hypothetical protein
VAATSRSKRFCSSTNDLPGPGHLVRLCGSSVNLDGAFRCVLTHTYKRAVLVAISTMTTFEEKGSDVNVASHLLLDVLDR